MVKKRLFNEVTCEHRTRKREGVNCEILRGKSILAEGTADVETLTSHVWSSQDVLTTAEGWVRGRVAVSELRKITMTPQALISTLGYFFPE